LVCDITRARVSMPKSTDHMTERCHAFRATYPLLQKKAALV
jgi:hypothetical protein